VNRWPRADALRGSWPDHGEPVLNLKRGEWVLVEDVTVYDGRVVVVIGVTAVIRVKCQDGGGETYRAAELACCRPRLDEMSVDVPSSPAKAAKWTGAQASSAARRRAQSKGPAGSVSGLDL
jgi:hypothetical protein